MMKLWLRDIEQLVQSHRDALCHGLGLPSGLHRFKASPLYNSPGLSWITEFALTHNNVIPQMTPRLKGRNKSNKNKTNVTFWEHRHIASPRSVRGFCAKAVPHWAFWLRTAGVSSWELRFEVWTAKQTTPGQVGHTAAKARPRGRGVRPSPEAVRCWQKHEGVLTFQDYHLAMKERVWERCQVTWGCCELVLHERSNAEKDGRNQIHCDPRPCAVPTCVLCVHLCGGLYDYRENYERTYTAS